MSFVKNLQKNIVNILIFKILGKQYICNNNLSFLLKTNFKLSNNLFSNEVLAIDLDNIFYLGNPFLKDFKLELNTTFLNSKKKQSIKFKRRKRYKIISGFINYKYICNISKIWQKRKQLVL
ncbi:MAG: hypothetical protein AAYR31_00515 [Candidatus Vidania fulgoroideorum]